MTIKIKTPSQDKCELINEFVDQLVISMAETYTGNEVHKIIRFVDDNNLQHETPFLFEQVLFALHKHRVLITDDELEKSWTNEHTFVNCYPFMKFVAELHECLAGWGELFYAAGSDIFETWDFIYWYLASDDKEEFLSRHNSTRLKVSRMAKKYGIDIKKLAKDVNFEKAKMIEAERAKLYGMTGMVCKVDDKRAIGSFTYDEKEDWTQSTIEIKGITPELAKEIQALLIGTIKFTNK